MAPAETRRFVQVLSPMARLHSLCSRLDCVLVSRFVFSCILTATLATAVPLSAAEQPNIVLILADDLGYGDLSCQGSTQIKTPHIDALAASGMSMTQGYVSAPVCAPSRAGLMTGRNQANFGFLSNLTHEEPGFDSNYAGLDTKEITIASRLKQAGYRTGLVGKWHLGHLPQYHPLKRGFDEFWGFLGGGYSYFPTVAPGKDEPKMESNVEDPPRIGQYVTDDLGTQAIKFIERNRAKPFFLYAAFTAPHAPMHATKEDLELYAHIKDKKRRTYCAMVHRLDVNVGRIREALKRTGLEEKTLVVFLSDNGGPVDQNASMNAPLNGQKGILLEGGIRVPFMLSWPGTLAAGKRFTESVSSLDLAPTFLALAGGQNPGPKAFDGVNLMPFLRDDKAGPVHREMKWRFTISGAIREGDWKLVRLPDRFPLLFDLGKDPGESHNVFEENMDIARDLLKRFGQWEATLANPKFMEGAEWKIRQLNLYDSKFPTTQPAKGEDPVMIPHGRTY